MIFSSPKNLILFSVTKVEYQKSSQLLGFDIPPSFLKVIKKKEEIGITLPEFKEIVLSSIKKNGMFRKASEQQLKAKEKNKIILI